MVAGPGVSEGASGTVMALLLAAPVNSYDLPAASEGSPGWFTRTACNVPLFPPPASAATVALVSSTCHTDTVWVGAWVNPPRPALCADAFRAGSTAPTV